MIAQLVQRFFQQFLPKPNVGDFRIVRSKGAFEVQQYWKCGLINKCEWFPLNHNGCWLESSAYETGNITKHLRVTKDQAQKILFRARAIYSETDVLKLVDS